MSDDKILQFDKKTKTDLEGYPTYEFDFDGEPMDLRIHEVIAQALIPNPDCAPYVIHKDGNKMNYDVSNLEWSFTDDDGNECEDIDFDTVFGNPFIVLAANNVKEYVNSKTSMLELVEIIQGAALSMFGKFMSSCEEWQKKEVQEYGSELTEVAKWKPIYITDPNGGHMINTHCLINRIGQVWDKRDKRTLKDCIDADGFTLVALNLPDRTIYERVDRLVAMSFVPNPLHQPYVKHKYGVRHDNMYKHLRWTYVPQP